MLDVRTEPEPSATMSTSPWLPRLALIAVAALQVVGTFGASSEQPDARDIDALAIVLLLAGPLALAVLWDRPVIAMGFAVGISVVYIGAGYPYGPFAITPMVGLVRGAATGHRRAAITTGIVGVAASMAAHLVSPRDDDLGWDELAAVSTWVAIVLVVGEILRARSDRRAHAARASAEQARRRASEERLRIAQELHDVLAHNISLINVQAGVGLHLMETHPEQARESLASIKSASKDALDELRFVLDLLRTGEAAPRAPNGGLDQLDALVARVRTPRLDVQLERFGDPVPVPAGVDLAAYRIAQEALTNVVRHAVGATRATVRITYADDAITVQVDDDGRVAAATGTTHRPAHRAGDLTGEDGGSGIAGMRDRAIALGGDFHAGVRAGGGFRVRARLPLFPPPTPADASGNGATP